MDAAQKEYLLSKLDDAVKEVVEKLRDDAQTDEAIREYLLPLVGVRQHIEDNL
jgi:hypothetical protein